MTTAHDICAKAASLVSGDRAKTHGEKTENHENIAKLWSAYLGVMITPLQAALMVALLKIARTKAGSHNPDDYVDLAGYAGVAGEIAERRNQTTSLTGVGDFLKRQYFDDFERGVRSGRIPTLRGSVAEKIQADKERAYEERLAHNADPSTRHARPMPFTGDCE